MSGISEKIRNRKHAMIFLEDKSTSPKRGKSKLEMIDEELIEDFTNNNYLIFNGNNTYFLTPEFYKSYQIIRRIEGQNIL